MYKKIKIIISVVVASVVGTGCIPLKTEFNPVDYVDPFIGTDYHGHTFPGAALPGGMVQLSPDTGVEGWDWCSGYHYSDNSVMGFSHLHRSGMGAGDWGDILLMPTTGKLQVVPGSKENPDEGYRSRFSHDSETASPGYYSVFLDDYAVQAELTVTERAGFHRYTFSEAGPSHIVLDAGHGIRNSYRRTSEVKIISDTEIVGHRYSHGFVKHKNVYFCARFSRPFDTSGTWNGENIKSGSKEDSGSYLGAFVNYKVEENETIEVKVGISYTSIEQARLNLDTEIPGWNFNETKQNAEQKWNDVLSKIEVEASEANNELYNKNKKVTFYTALYHSLLFPAIFSDVDGKYTGLDNQIHVAKDFTYLSDFSLWDTHRAEMPLLTLIDPQRNINAIRTMLAQYEQGGWLPTPQQFGNSYTNDMIGDHPVAAIADALKKGIADFDSEKAYEAVKKNAMEIPSADHRSKGRIGLDYYMKNGYLPYDKVRESVSRTLEYAYNDWCIAQIAKELGKEDDYKLFMQRAASYKNLMDSETGLARPKDNDGKWQVPFNPTFVGHGDQRHYTEANAWQYTWFVPHDVQGLIDFEGGRQPFISKLDTLFTMSSEVQETVSDVTGLIGQYAHGNEPSHHTLYLYNYAGAPWKSQELARKVMDELYHSGPDGLCGNEDMGQMSAWYVLSSMGFYPVAPGQNVYCIGSPEFSKITIHLDKKYYGADIFSIESENNSKDNRYIHSATIDGITLDQPWFSHDKIYNGGKIVFKMGTEPNKKWGSDKNAAPPSMTK
uniref:GH92 family glycosyl hydrolase n=1 Tax=uncultured Draconibacterium sp. TaxID=1573823 RepID=UPI003217E3A4